LEWSMWNRFSIPCSASFASGNEADVELLKSYSVKKVKSPLLCCNFVTLLTF
jgi:hypothetical protein